MAMVNIYHLWLRYPVALYSTFTLREMELAVQLSCERKKKHFIERAGKRGVEVEKGQKQHANCASVSVVPCSESNACPP